MRYDDGFVDFAEQLFRQAGAFVADEYRQRPCEISLMHRSALMGRSCYEAELVLAQFHQTGANLCPNNMQAEQ